MTYSSFLPRLRLPFSFVYFRGISNTKLHTTASPKGKTEGGWDSTHVFESIDRGRQAHYKLTSTVILHLGTNGEGLGEMELSGNMTRQVEQDMQVSDDDSHIVNVGRLVEDMELKMRNLLRGSSCFIDILFLLASESHISPRTLG